MTTRNSAGKEGREEWDWFVILATFFIRLTVPSLRVCFGVIYLELVQREGMTNTEVSWIVAVFIATFYISCPLSTSLSSYFNHCSHRALVFIGILLISVGLAICSLPLRLPYLIFFYGVLTGLGSSLTSTNSFLVTQKYFDKKRSTVNFLASLGASLSLLVMPLAIYVLIKYFTLRGAFLLWSSIIFNGLVGAMFYDTDRWRPESRCPENQKLNRPPRTEVPGNTKIFRDQDSDFKGIEERDAQSVTTVAEINTKCLKNENEIKSAENGSEEHVNFGTNVVISTENRNLNRLRHSYLKGNDIMKSLPELHEYEDCSNESFHDFRLHERRPQSFMSTATSVDSFKTMKSIYISAENMFASLEYLDMPANILLEADEGCTTEIKDTETNTKVSANGNSFSETSAITNRSNNYLEPDERVSPGERRFTRPFGLISLAPLTNIIFIAYMLSSVVNKQIHLSYIIYLPLIAMKIGCQQQIPVLLAILSVAEFVGKFSISYCGKQMWMPVRCIYIAVSLLNSISCIDECQKNEENWTKKLDEFFTDEIPRVYDKLPWLNETPLHDLQANQVVRYRGMIQDMQDPEFYMDIYMVKKEDGSESSQPGRFLDVVSCRPSEEIILNSPHCETRDRNSYFCIPIPGENEWVKQIYTEQNPKTATSPRSKTEVKRKREEEQEERLNSVEDSMESNDENTSQFECKKFKDESKAPAQDSSKNVSTLMASKYPLPSIAGTSCLLKVYDDSANVLLNDVVEVVGILSLDPSLAASCEGENEDSLFESHLKDRSFPPSVAPRLHAISIKKKQHCNPLVPTVVDRNNVILCSSNIRELIGSVLDVVFLGDELAAEYFICHLISSVYLRQDIMPLGKFSINLSGITKELQDKNYPQLLYGLIQSLTTHSYFFPMTLENMNTVDFVPKKDYQENSLKSGFLQLPASLHLVVDETQLTAGQLDSKGLRNLTSLGTLMNWQKVDYDFQFHSLEQHTNVPVLILSEGKAMINSDCQIRFDPKHTNVSLAFNQVSSLLSPKVLAQLRTHLTLARLAPYTLSEDMQKNVQEDFVSSRRHENGMSADDLHGLLTLTKLLAQSCGKIEMTEEIWKSAKMLEVERKGRLREN